MAQVVLGNVYNKYESENVLARRLVRGYLSALKALVREVNPGRILEVGCGEGHLSGFLADWLPQASVVGIDLSARLFPSVPRRRNLIFLVQSAYSLGFSDNSFDLVIGAEVLEHLEQPGAALKEMVRLSRRHVIASVPREPLWRFLNLARFAYVRDLGNTPGHLQHWRKHDFLRLLEGYGEIRAVRSPPPWTMALLEKTGQRIKPTRGVLIQAGHRTSEEFRDESRGCL
jgi:ubiquinone/menaquinone biosynthesis C-methylase UbiE